MKKHIEESEQEWKARQKITQANLPIKKREVSKPPKKGVQTGKEPSAKPKVITLDLLEDLNAGKPKFVEAPKKRKRAKSPQNANDKPKTDKRREYKLPDDAPRVHKRKGEKGYFRLNCHKVFLTVPQYKGTMTPKTAMDKLKEFCKSKGRNVLEAIVCLEKHGKNAEGKGIEKDEDPGVHFHLAFEVDKIWNIQKADYFDQMFFKHVHAESCKDWQKVVVYCTKEGNYVVENINIEALKEAVQKKKGVKHVEVALDILKNPNEGIETYVNKFPGYVLQHQKKVLDFMSLAQTINVEKVPFLGINDYSQKNEQTQIVCKWLVDNLWPKPRAKRQKQLYIYGPTCIGKTTLLERLQDSFNTYLVAEEASCQFWTDFHDNYELAIFDEFNGCKTITQMNAFVEGARVKLSGKGISAVLKKRNIPVIICSNKSPREVYHNVAEKNKSTIEAFENRFIIVDCNNFTEGMYLDVPWTEIEDLYEENHQGNLPDPLDLLKSKSILQLPEDDYECSITEVVEKDIPEIPAPLGMDRIRDLNGIQAFMDQNFPVPEEEQSSEYLEEYSQYSQEHFHN